MENLIDGIVKGNKSEIETYREKQYFEKVFAENKIFFALKCEDGAVIYQILNYEEMDQARKSFLIYDKLFYEDELGNKHFVTDFYMPVGLKFYSLRTGEEA